MIPSMGNGLIDAAIADCETLLTLDGRTMRKGNGIATEGRFQVYVVRVTDGHFGRRKHHRITFYLQNEDGKYKRVARELFESEMAKEVCR